MVDIKNLLPNVKEDVLLAPYTTFRIGGKSQYFFSADNNQELVKAVKAAKESRTPFFVLGGGSNVLISDNGFQGLVIRAENSQTEVRDSCIYAEAGVPLADVVILARDHFLTGIEWAAGIYGTVGGAVRGNAGAFGGDMSQITEQADALDTSAGEVKNFSQVECAFNYRSSIFKQNKNLIIISAVFRLQTGEKENIEKKSSEHIQYRKENHPLDFPSAGSIFKSIDLKNFPESVVGQYPEIKNFSDTVPAGFLIEKAGLKGKRIGDAEISNQHANFIVNLGQAKAKDVLDLIKLAKQEVQKTFKVRLEEELVLIGFLHS